MIDYIKKGDIHIHPNFFDDNLFDSIKSDMRNLNYVSTYQPDTYYGNRLQAYPCYEAEYNKYNSYITNKLSNILRRDVLDFKVIARKTLLSELKQSTSFGRFGFTHKDINSNDKSIMAGMMYFEQSYGGGTAFFENYWDKEADIYVSAYPNRLVLYDGNRWHAPAIDKTFEERTTLSFFFNTGKENGK